AATRSRSRRAGMGGRGPRRRADNANPPARRSCTARSYPSGHAPTFGRLGGYGEGVVGRPAIDDPATALGGSAPAPRDRKPQEGGGGGCGKRAEQGAAHVG